MTSLSSSARVDGDGRHRSRSRRQDAQGPLDLVTLIDLVRRRYPLVLTMVAIGAGLAIIISLGMKPVFTSAAEIELDPVSHQEIEATPSPTAPAPDQGVVDTAVAVMRLRAIAAAVVDKLDLSDNPEFSSAHRGLIASLTGGAKGPLTSADRRQNAIGALQKRIAIQRQGSTYLVNVAASSQDPVEAARMANAYASEYIQQSLSSQLSGASQDADWLKQRLAVISRQAESADAAVAQYKSANGITTSGQGGQTVTDQQIAQLTSQLATAASDAAASRSNLVAARTQVKAGGLESVASVLSSSVVANLRSQRAEVMRNAADIQSRYGPKHPETLKVRQQIDSLDDQIKAEGQRIMDGLESTASSSAARAETLRAMLNDLKGQQSSNGRASVEADALQRKADATRLMYNQLAQLAQVRSQERESQATTGRLVEPALASSVPSYPNRKLFALLGVLIGAVAGIVIILLLEVLDATIRTVEDVRTYLDASVITSVPRLTARQLLDLNADPASASPMSGPFARFIRNPREFYLDEKGTKPALNSPADFLLAKPMSTFAESIRNVRSSLTIANQHLSSAERSAVKGGKIIAITSALPNEGKTTFAASLARIMALGEEKVLLIDCDLRRRALQQLFKMEFESGLQDVLAGKIQFDKAIRRDLVPGLDVLVENQQTFNVVDALSSGRMNQLLAELRQRYDYIIIDTPPALALVDARTVCALADGVLMVVRWRYTTRQAAQAAIARIEADGANILGVVLSMVDVNLRNQVGTLNPAYYHRVSEAYCDE